MNKIRKVCQLLFLVLCISIISGGKGSVVHAEEDYPSDLELLDGSTEYMDTDEYMYWLDIENVGLLGAIHAAYNLKANTLFKVIESTGRITVSVFCQCTQFNVADIFGDAIKNIQEKLYKSMFIPLLWAGLAMTGVKIVGRIWKRNLTAALGDIIAVILVMSAAVYVTVQSDTVLYTVLYNVNQISNNVMTDMNTALSGEGETDEYVSSAAGVIWENMVHIPWRQLEFGKGVNQIDKAKEKSIMGMTDLLLRKQEIQKLYESGESPYNVCFSGEVGATRMAKIIYYLPFVMVKAFILIALFVLRFVLQLLTVIFAFLAFVVLALALFPGFEFRIVEAWLKKLLAYQVSALAIAVFTSALLFIDNAIMMKMASHSWMVANVFEMAIALGIFFGRKKLFDMLDTIHRAVQMPRYAVTAMRNSGRVQPVNSKVGQQIKGVAKYLVMQKFLGSAAGEAKEANTGKNAAKAKKPKTDDYKNVKEKSKKSASQEHQKKVEEKNAERRKSVPRPNTQSQDEGKTAERKEKVKADKTVDSSAAVGVFSGVRLDLEEEKVKESNPVGVFSGVRLDLEEEKKVKESNPVGVFSGVSLNLEEEKVRESNPVGVFSGVRLDLEEEKVKESNPVGVFSGVRLDLEEEKKVKESNPVGVFSGVSLKPEDDIQDTDQTSAAQQGDRGGNGAGKNQRKLDEKSKNMNRSKALSAGMNVEVVEKERKNTQRPMSTDRKEEKNE